MPVIDSNVYASVVVKDEFYEKCKEYMLMKKVTLDLAFAEAGNVIWKHVRMGRIKREDALKRAEALKRLISTSEVYESKDFLVEAVESAVKYDITVYDALFLVLTKKLNEELVTTDQKLWEKLKYTDASHLIKCLTSPSD
ncbi:MAG: type II toxin-antitoxin system VapC family toxin [Archaeoglobaceae archaeon]